MQQKILNMGKGVGKAAAKIAAFSIAPGSERFLFNNNNNQQQQAQMQQRQLQLQLQQQQQLLQLQQQQLRMVNQPQTPQYQVINGVT
jgi:hypothetical protein